ncbi:hypothetical protein PVAND_014603 [Polypedilum vanderplanki]|uniref:Reverse transcriptase domain-containing protein n=1 Tax=Polypedilum vanderplanki TaxID=319348 RepID=A0A9J6B9N3_POLVA|nr:hypothetical protein PVAND_014603 [Polypedilum vanderplanki]
MTCVDLSKAFDCLNHDLLAIKLKKIGLNESFYKLLVSYISDRQQIVKNNSSFSDMRDIIRGTPQGGVLSGLLFILYVNSIFKLQLFGEIHLYCDDITIVNSAHNSIVLQPIVLKSHIETDLSKVDKWLKFHYLSPNKDKSNYTIS